MNTKNKFLQWLYSTWLAQLIGYIFIGGWCFIRHNDRRFLGVSRSLFYEKDSELSPGAPLRKWKTWVCVRVPTSYDGVVQIVFDTFTDQRLALVKKSFQGGDLIAFRVGPEDAHVRFAIREWSGDLVRIFTLDQPEFVCRWTQTGGRGLVPQELWDKLEGKDPFKNVIYI